MKPAMDDIWEAERRLWLEGVGAYRELMAEQCVMAFGPSGVMDNHAILEGLKDSPRWSSVAFADQASIRPGDGAAVIAYTARGEREGADTYRALCTSTYVLIGGHWRIAQHQQTPLD